MVPGPARFCRFAESGNGGCRRCPRARSRQLKICLATIHVKPAFIPLSLLYLKAYLVDRLGYQPGAIEILEFPRESDEEDILREILNAEPDVVGLSCYLWNIKKLMGVSQRLKTLRPNVRIVLGGPEVGPVAGTVL